MPPDDADDLADDGGDDPAAKADGVARGSLATAWARRAAAAVRVHGLSPPHAARIYGYVGLAMFEASQLGLAEPDTMMPRLTDPSPLPRAERRRYSARGAVIAAAERTLAALIPAAAPTLAAARVADRAALAGVAADTLARSEAHGEAVARAVIARAERDGFAATRGAPYTLPSGPAAWVPIGDQRPLEPHWGTLTPFGPPAVVAVCGEEAGAPPAFSTAPDSELWRQAQQVIAAGRDPDPRHAEIAYFWSDAAAQTSTPPGHWFELAAQVADAEALGLRDSARTLALVGMATADAFVTGWAIKYEHVFLRPVTYIQRHIDPAWQPRLMTPPHPDFVSGHAVGSGAAAAVLTSLLGPDYAFVDRTREGTVVRDQAAVARTLGRRAFPSFEAAAEEAAASRLSGGIHFPRANAAGLAAGRCVATRLLDELGE